MRNGHASSLLSIGIHAAALGLLFTAATKPGSILPRHKTFDTTTLIAPFQRPAAQDKDPAGGGGVRPSGGAGGRGSVLPAALIWKIEPEYSDEARRAKVQGTVLLYLEVDEQGKPRNVHVRQGLGLGLDEKAVEAVTRWKFRPGR